MNTKAKKLRREGYVTGNVFGKTIEGSIPLQFPVKEIEHLLKTKNKGSQIMLDIDGEQMDVLIKEIDYNSMKHKVEEIDFQHVGDTIKVKDLPIASDKDVDLQIDPEEIVVMLSESHNAPIEEEETASEE